MWDDMPASPMSPMSPSAGGRRGSVNPSGRRSLSWMPGNRPKPRPRAIPLTHSETIDARRLYDAAQERGGIYDEWRLLCELSKLGWRRREQEMAVVSGGYHWRDPMNFEQMCAAAERAKALTQQEPPANDATALRFAYRELLMQQVYADAAADAAALAAVAVSAIAADGAPAARRQQPPASPQQQPQQQQQVDMQLPRQDTDMDPMSLSMSFSASVASRRALRHVILTRATVDRVLKNCAVHPDATRPWFGPATETEGRRKAVPFEELARLAVGVQDASEASGSLHRFNMALELLPEEPGGIGSVALPDRLWHCLRGAVSRRRNMLASVQRVRHAAGGKHRLGPGADWQNGSPSPRSEGSHGRLYRGQDSPQAAASQQQQGSPVRQQRWASRWDWLERTRRRTYTHAAQRLHGHREDPPPPLPTLPGPDAVHTQRYITAGEALRSLANLSHSYCATTPGTTASPLLPPPASGSMLELRGLAGSPAGSILASPRELALSFGSQASPRPYQQPPDLGEQSRSLVRCMDCLQPALCATCNPYCEACALRAAAPPSPGPRPAPRARSPQRQAAGRAKGPVWRRPGEPLGAASAALAPGPGERLPLYAFGDPTLGPRWTWRFRVACTGDADLAVGVASGAAALAPGVELRSTARWAYHSWRMGGFGEASLWCAGEQVAAQLPVLGDGSQLTLSADSSCDRLWVAVDGELVSEQPLSAAWCQDTACSLGPVRPVRPCAQILTPGCSVHFLSKVATPPAPAPQPATQAAGPSLRALARSAWRRAAAAQRRRNSSELDGASRGRSSAEDLPGYRPQVGPFRALALPPTRLPRLVAGPAVAPALRRWELGSGALSGKLSPAFPADSLLHKEARKGARVPPAATLAHWAYPAAAAVHGGGGDTTPRGNGERALAYHGGLIFTNATGEVLAATAFAPGGGGGAGAGSVLRLCGPYPWRPEWTTELDAARRWAPECGASLRDGGVRSCCWVLPGERLQGGTTHWPHGALAVLFRDPLDPPSSADCYFCVETAFGTAGALGAGSHPRAAATRRLPQHGPAILPPCPPPAAPHGSSSPQRRCPLGPYDVAATHLAATLRTAPPGNPTQYTIDLTGPLSPLAEAGVRGTGALSPPQPCASMCPDERRRRLVPQAAARQSWAYPLRDVQLAGSAALSSLDRIAPEAAFVAHGGWVYFDGSGDVCGVTAADDFTGGQGAELVFDAARPLRPEWCQALGAQGRWQPVCSDRVRRTGARLWCYLSPEEDVGDSSAGRWPYGAVAFLGREQWDGPVHPRDCYHAAAMPRTPRPSGSPGSPPMSSRASVFSSPRWFPSVAAGRAPARMKSLRVLGALQLFDAPAKELDPYGGKAAEGLVHRSPQPALQCRAEADTEVGRLAAAALRRPATATGGAAGRQRPRRPASAAAVRRQQRMQWALAHCVPPKGAAPELGEALRGAVAAQLAV
eukprot:TRINITY_DN1234_c2_g1_i1.p1 TRINITY_DN1234_c2_g1~~TRINITY_DN1234_c2_g1_i1.p1  ORF type:complete len:1476 (+),score=262.91 TRINITY_DN1234_c2_g1_i1:91-4428(+)